MAHEKDKIRVKRKGNGHLKVTVDPGDEAIGNDATILTWIKRPASDTDPGDNFAFDPNNPIIGLPSPPFFPLTKGKNQVKYAYSGWPGDFSWTYTINVIDLSAESDAEWILSDGSATIKNK